MTKTLPLLLVAVLLGGPAQADKVTRTVSKDGTAKIFIRGEGGRERLERSQPTAGPAAEQAQGKDFAVYELEKPTPSSPTPPTVIVIGTPPPIAPSAAAYGYGYGYGYPGYGPGYSYPGYGYPGYGYPLRPHCAPVPWRPAHHPGPRTNYQNPPVNYQNAPLNYQNRAGTAPYRGARHR